MRRLALAAVPVLALVAVGFVNADADRVPEPKFASITGACNASGSPQVQPGRIQMLRADNVVWREPSGRAASFTIEPKNPQDWAFAQASFTGTPQQPATTPPPSPNAVAGHPYAYKVTIRCSDGSTQVIDPDLVIGGAQVF